MHHFQIGHRHDGGNISLKKQLFFFPRINPQPPSGSTVHNICFTLYIFTMTRSKWIFGIVICALTALFTACQQQEDMDDVLTEEEAVATLESEFQVADGGMTYEALDATEVADENAATIQANCGWTGDSTFSYANSQNGRSVSYAFAYVWEVSCLGQIPQTFALTTERDGSASGPRYAGNASANGDYTVDSLVIGTNYLLNAQYDLEADRTFTGQNRTREVEIDLSITLTDVVVSKGSQQIQSGQGTYTLIGTRNGNSRTFTGTATFLGNGTVQIVVNGNTYTITL